MEAESALHWELRQNGHALYLEGQAVTRHLNFARFSSWAPLHVMSGRRFAATRALSWSSSRRLLYTLASPLIPWVRLRRIYRETTRPGRYAGSMARLIPVLLLGLLLDAFGQMLGYALGDGGSTNAKITGLELSIDKRVGVPPVWTQALLREAP